MKKADYEKYFKEHTLALYDCVIYNNEVLLFLLIESPTEHDPTMTAWDYKFGILDYEFLNDIAVWGSLWDGGARRPKIAYDFKEKRTLIVDFDSRAWESKQPHRGFPLYEIHAKDSCTSLRTIDGDIYSVGKPRALWKKTGFKEWEKLSDPEKHPSLHEDLNRARKEGRILDMDYGFYDVHGFSANDIYACGRGGDLWHYNGERWRRLDPPVNSSLEQILCAPDGMVYVAGDLGVLLRGREDKWEVIPQKLTMSPFEGIAWFQDTLYLSTSWGLYYFRNNIFWEVDFGDGDRQTSFQHVKSNGEILVSFGPRQALVYDGKTWKKIIP